MDIEFNPFEEISNQPCEPLLPTENVLVNELRELWRSRENRAQPTLDPIQQWEKEQQEKLYRRELRYVTQMYTVFKVGPSYFRKHNENEEDEYFEYAEPNWNNLKEYSKAKESGRKRGRPKKEVYIEEPISPPKKGFKGRPKGSLNLKSNWIIKLLKWDEKAERIKTTRQYYKFLKRDFPLKSFKNKEYKIPKKQWKLRKQILASHLQKIRKI